MSLARMVGCAVFSGVVVLVGSVSAEVIMRLVPAEVDLPPGESVTFQVMLEADPAQFVRAYTVELPCSATGGAFGSVHFSAALVDPSNPDYVFAGVQSIPAVDQGDCPDGEGPRLGAVTLFVGDGANVIDPVYLGEFTYTASIDAAGDFQIAIIEGGVGDDDVEVTLVGAVVHTSIDVGDSDLDGDIDLLDARDLQNCFTGSGGGVPEGCEAMDLDADDDVDLIDHTIWATMMTGPE